MRKADRRPLRKARKATGRIRRLHLENLEDRRVMAGDAVLDWNAIALEAVKNDASLAPPDEGGPTRAANALAIVHLAMYDAVNAMDGSHAPYRFTSHAAQTASMDAAVATAAHATLVKYWPQQEAFFDQAYVDYLAGIPDGLAQDQGVALGNAAAGRMMFDRFDDGSANDTPFPLTNEPGHHQPDPLHPNQGLLTPNWGGVKPFSMDAVENFLPGPPPALDSAEYVDAFNEVKVLGAVDAETADRDGNGLPDRTVEQTQIGLYWGYDGAKGLGTPPRLYNQIARVIAEQQGNTIVDNARLFAMLNMTMADAGIAAWNTKYIYDFWRPVVAIREGDGDGNAATVGEADWAPLGAPASNSDNPNGDFTPPFPAYTSGHATFGAAAFRTIERFYGTDEIAFDFMSDELNGVTKDAHGNVRPAVVRHFDRLSDATWENAISRIYLGVHWIFDATAGVATGTAIADFMFDHEMFDRAVPHDPVMDWNWVALEAMRRDSMLPQADLNSPTMSSLALGYVHAAIYDAVSAIDGTLSTYAFTVKGAQDANLDAAVASSAHAVLALLFPSQRAELDAELDAYLAGIPNDAAKREGIAVGRSVANRLMGSRENDGRNASMDFALTDAPGHHQRDPLHPNQPILTPQWGEITPFAMTAGDQFLAPPPPALDSDAYTAAYNEVMIAGAEDAETADRDGNGLPDRTREQTEIGLFWAYDGSRNMATPPRLYNQMVRAIAEEQGNTVIENARLFALVNISMADAGIASWGTKYVYDFWRPIVGIRNGDSDGNPDTVGDPNWRPLGAPASNSGDPDGNFTPPFPAYTSGHATFGGAVFHTLQLFYGTDQLPFTFQSDEMNGVTAGADGGVRAPLMRHFDTLSQAMEENGQSRIYLGIHWAFDKALGIEQGSQIADYVFQHEFRPRMVFQNEEHPTDVNGDGQLSIADVVTQVVQIRSLQETGEMAPGFEGFCDVNDDQHLTIGDLVIVVDAMRSQAAGEAIPGENGGQGSGKGFAAVDAGTEESPMQLISADFGQELAIVAEDEPVEQTSGDASTGAEEFETMPAEWDGASTGDDQPLESTMIEDAGEGPGEADPFCDLPHDA